ncbi:riboflavin kinase [Diplogelasinospora grovesii]|uniref:Riboflavin kinase n=1 Tax=Diplogelasinospora grovesii TaxID=303347 RepID=A0AAN6NA58_9PEZI|nr:riboflavin kinase [Diplogelasinospora grovesii]
MGSTATDDRPLLIGPDSGPEPPFPLRMEGRVISGFGRGSKELGIPTANLPVDASQTPWINDAKSGVYFGWAALRLPPTHPDNHDHTTDRFEVYPMVMSIGYNPFYKNTVRSAEVHVLHKFAADFYGVEMRLLLTGYIREEKDYNGLEALIADIETDCLVARNSLERPGWIPAQKGGQLDDQGRSRSKRHHHHHHRTQQQQQQQERQQQQQQQQQRWRSRHK